MKKAKTLRTAVLMVLCVLCLMATASAATVSKVTCKNIYSGSTQYAKITGKTSGGKTVWTYKSAKYAATELTAVNMKVKGSYVYVLEGNKYVRLGKQSGKVLVKKSILSSGNSMGSAKMVVSSKGNLYAMGYYGTTVYRISSTGKIDWKRNLGQSYYWPTKLAISGSNLIVNGGEEPRWKATLSTATGKVKSKYTY